MHPSIGISSRNALLLRLLVVAFLAADSSGLDMVKLSSSSSFGTYDRTSSTLIWDSHASGKSLPRHAVPIDKNYPSKFWCRARVSGVLVPGSVEDSGVCVVAFIKSVYEVEDFDVLVSINGSARIHLVPWDSFLAKPDNALLSSDRVLVIVHSADNPDVLVPGHVGERETDRVAVVLDGKRMYESDRGYILVEDEPVGYTLREITYEEKYDQESKQPVVLNSTQLVNEGPVTAVVSQLLSYKIREKQYWGRPKGTISALPAHVYPPTGKSVEVLWGVESTLSKVSFAEVEYELPPGSAVNVTLIGTMKKYEAPYSGVLEAVYEDGFTRSREIKSYHVDEVLVAAIVEYDSPYFVNGTSMDIDGMSKLVYESTTTSTTTTTTTTSTTTTTTTTKTTTTISTTTPPPPTTTTSPAARTDGQSTVSSEDDVHMFLQPESLEKMDENSMREEGKKQAKRSQSSGTSDKFISGFSTVGAAIVFWYYGAVAA